MACFVALSATAQSPTLTVTGRDTSKTYTQKALLAHPAVRSVTVTDPVYRRPMTYRAIPLAELLKGTGIGADDHVQARAIDNFSVSIPGRLPPLPTSAQIEALPRHRGSRGALAGHTGQARQGERRSVLHRLASCAPPAHVSSEYWAYRLAALARSPTAR